MTEQNTLVSDEAAADPLPFRDPGYVSDPYPHYAALRQSQPVYRHTDGFWVITGFDDINTVLADRAVSVAELDFGPVAWLHESALGADAPQHTRLRRAHARWFTPRAVARWTELVREEVASRLDAIEASGAPFDVVTDLAFPVTFTTICRIFGIPVAAGSQVLQATHEIAASLGLGPTDQEADISAKAFAWFVDHIDQLIAAKRADPGDGLLDTFLGLEAAGDMSRDEVVASMTLLFAVGHLDISYLIVNGVRMMAETPALFEAYRDQPDKRGSIINEILRIDTPEQYVVRQTLEPLEVGGTAIPAAEVVVCFIGAGNRDPRVFQEPDRFDFDRDGSLSKHLAFGAGVHACAGQVLARAEADEVFTALTERFERLELAGPVQYGHSEFIRAITALPVSAT